jgi:hypothetical protein
MQSHCVRCHASTNAKGGDHRGEVSPNIFDGGCKWIPIFGNFLKLLPDGLK